MNTKYLTSVKIFYTIFFFPTLLIMMTLRRIYGVFSGIVEDFLIMIDIWTLSPTNMKKELEKIRKEDAHIHPHNIDRISINTKDKSDQQILKEITDIVKESLKERKGKQ